MHGWLQKLFKSRGALSTQREKDDEITKTSVTSLSVSSSSTLSLHSSATALSKTQQLQTALRSDLRWKRKYDVFVCHSSAHRDIEEATRLVLFLEAAPHILRCFLWQRDACPGAAIHTEFCQAVQDSHIQALLITPSFVQDHWCKYMMHQVLAEGPMSNRLIPMLQNLAHSQYPQELKFYYYIDLSKNPDQGYSIVRKTVLTYLEDLIKKFKDVSGHSDGGLDEEGSSKKGELSKYEPTGTSFPLEVMQRRDESFRDICCDHN
ncbi:toll/interleukin-1 receptor domain-containing adapter protein [Melanotaenia boesemani]|uniref:toll/interleukin-1 receptor domain-containing adapter protein n=1 Tax=Melanotaenia boesemani TaxID=1250792 RepID=UPI001C047794|nr:toll/interleukin-1 receptor domain-containing adapter protein [Melanotaenia boesemani]